jgi:predicted transglutaminase-like cysteine proteinase
MRWKEATAMVLAGIFAALPASAQPSDLPFLPMGRETEAPRGFVDMCRSDATFCGPVGGAGDAALRTAAVAPAEVGPPAPPPSALSSTRDGPERIMAGDQTQARTEMTLLNRVNRLVNGRVRQRTDMEIFGQPELWRRSGVERGAQGDCEDLAIEKRYELTDAGFDPHRLYFAVVYAPRIGLHTVLVARLTSGDMVLDSRTPYVTHWQEADYSWVSIQSMNDPMRWHALGDRRFDVAEAVGFGPVTRHS